MLRLARIAVFFCALLWVHGAVAAGVDLDKELLRARAEVHYLFLTKVGENLTRDCRPDFSLLPEVVVADHVMEQKGQYVGGFERRISVDRSLTKDAESLRRVLFHEYFHHVTRKFTRKCLGELSAQLATVVGTRLENAPID